MGAFRCPADHPNFAHEGAIQAYEIVFPRTAVLIRRAGGKSFVADANLVTMYNRGQEYSRAALAAAGDNSDWYALDRATTLDIVRTVDPAIVDDDRPLRFPFAPGSPPLYLRQRRLFERLRWAVASDGLLVEEEIVGIFAAAVSNAYAARGVTVARRSAGDADAVSLAQRLLSENLAESLSLQELARRVGLSMFHLARSFRRATGSTLHAWRLRLRLLAALDALSEHPKVDLTALALDLGFSSHSHFTAAFRRHFGKPPSALRGEWAREQAAACRDQDRRIASRPATFR